MILNLNYSINQVIFSNVIDAVLPPTDKGTPENLPYSLAQIDRPADILSILEAGRSAYRWDNLVTRGSTNSNFYIPNDPRGCGTDTCAARQASQRRYQRRLRGWARQVDEQRQDRLRRLAVVPERLEPGGAAEVSVGGQQSQVNGAGVSYSAPLTPDQRRARIPSNRLG